MRVRSAVSSHSRAPAYVRTRKKRARDEASISGAYTAYKCIDIISMINGAKYSVSVVML